MKKVVAILTAAGSGTRLKENLPKSLVSLSDKKTLSKNNTIIELALNSLLQVQALELVLVTVPRKHVDTYKKVLLHNSSLKPLVESGKIRVVVGGTSRQNSIYKALVTLETETSLDSFGSCKKTETKRNVESCEQTTLESFNTAQSTHNNSGIQNLDGKNFRVENSRDEKFGKETALLIHDAARCFTPTKVINNLINTFYDKYDYLKNSNQELAFGIIPVLPISDTLKIIRNFSSHHDQDSQTVDRTRYFRVQTPQIFSLKQMLKLHIENRELGENENLSYTDDASMLEKNGGKIYHILGDELAFKITTPADLAYAKCLYNQQISK